MSRKGAFDVEKAESELVIINSEIDALEKEIDNETSTLSRLFRQRADIDSAVDQVKDRRGTLRRARGRRLLRRDTLMRQLKKERS